MSKNTEYRCTRCGTIPVHRDGPEVAEPRDLLTVKKILFVEMGAGGRSLRSRVADWLCPACVAGDPDWNMREEKNAS